MIMWELHMKNIRQQGKQHCMLPGVSYWVHRWIMNVGGGWIDLEFSLESKQPL